jgi:transitional endoplasmic reticulum ATPase
MSAWTRHAVCLCGPSGIDKTMLARVITHQTMMAFFRVSGPALVEKYLGDNPRWCATSSR